MNPDTDRRRVDHAGARSYLPAFCLAIMTVTSGCTAAARASGAPDPIVEARLEAATVPQSRAQVFFDWNMTDRDARFSGRGVLRIEPPSRVRVDLFGPRGETVAAAVLEEEHMRVAPDGAAALLPPPALLWASLGVFRAPSGVPLAATSVDGDAVTLEYARDPTLWRFRFRSDRLVGAEWTDGSGRRTVELAGTSDLAFPQQAAFRDWTEFRELTIRVTEVEERTTAFESDVWILPGER